MLTRKIRCIVVRVPEEDSAVPPRGAWREALPWADPYVLGLIRKLQDEVRSERAARFMAQREATATADDASLEVEYQGVLLEADTAPKQVPLTALAADGSPPRNVVTA